MKQAIACYIFLAVFSFFVTSCSKKVLVADDMQKMTDEHIILKKNGDYTRRNILLGFARIEKKTGRYIFIRDSIYFVNEVKKNVYETYAWGYIDTAARKFFLKIKNETEWQDFKIESIDMQNLYRPNSHTVR